MKRLFDILASGCGLLVLSPIFIIVAIWIKLDSPGPVFYRQIRVGRHNKDFRIFKFRSMRVGSDKGSLVTIGGRDPRVTRSGYFIRKFKIDELPQLINVFTGDMSLVGPRPEREFFYNQYDSQIPGFRNRLSVKPGLTGLAQIRGGYDLPPEEKLEHDMEYIRTQSIPLDLLCILYTIRLILTGEGAR